MVQSSVLGFPRMGVLRDLKKATEGYWAGKISRDELLAEGKRLRLAHWKLQKDAGVDIIPSNDFAFYDQVLDHIQLFNVRWEPLLFTEYKLIAVSRLFLSDIQSMDLTLSMNTSLWVAVTRRTASTCQAW